MDSNTILIIAGVGAAISAVIGCHVGSFRGREGEGLAYGFFLGPIGWIITALLPEAGEPCPECLGAVPKGARRCKHCGEKLPEKPKPILVPSPTPVQAVAVEHWFLSREDGSEGPYTKAQLKMFVDAGKFDPEHLCARKGDVEWKPLREIITTEPVPIQER